MRLLLPLFLALLAVPAAAQTLTVTGGATLRLENGAVLNLGTTTTLVEIDGGRVTGGTGVVRATRTLNAPSGENVAGLGAVLTSAQNLGVTTVTRGHDAPAVGVTAIGRYYDIEPATNSGLDATLAFSYHEAELNGLAETDLRLYRSDDGGGSWAHAGGTVDEAANTVTIGGLDGFSRWTAAINLVAVSPLDGPGGSPAPEPFTVPEVGQTEVFYAGSLSNLGPVALTIDGWPVITMPDLSQIVRRRPTVYTIPAGSSVDYSGAFNMLASFDPGTYLFAYNLGDHPSVVDYTDSFVLVKGGAGVRIMHPEAAVAARDVAAARRAPAGDVRTRSSASGPSASRSMAERAVAVLGTEEWVAAPPGADVAVVLAAEGNHEGEEATEAKAALEGSVLPVSTALLPAYPNPFNPVATVPFTVAEAGTVRLTVYDLLGREVVRLVDGHVEAGSHAAVFDASHLASGTYLVRLTTPGGTAQTQRLTLLMAP